MYKDDRSKCLRLFTTFFKIGAFTFGGGYAMIPLIKEDVLSNGWLELEELVNFIAVSESTPGPFAVNISTYIGMTKGGLLGAFAATFGVVLPSFIIILAIAGCYRKFCNSKLVKGIMVGLRPTVVGLIAVAVISIGVTVFFPNGIMIGVLFIICLNRHNLRLYRHFAFIINIYNHKLIS